MVCFRYIIVNTLHKGDNKDDDNDDDNNNNNNVTTTTGTTWVLITIRIHVIMGDTTNWLI